MKQGATWNHSGDLGDVLSSLPAVRQLGGGRYLLGPHVGPGAPREPMTPWRAAFLIPLLEAQPYIKSAKFSDKPERVTYDFSMFRVNTKVIFGESLAHWHGRHVGIKPSKLDVSPWLQVKPADETLGRIVFARSPRHHHRDFPWQYLTFKFRTRAMFVGTREEHQMFCSRFGRVEYRRVENALEMAQLIAGSDWFYGNQSLPCWIALGLGHNLTQEGFPAAPNSKIVRENAGYFGV